MDEQGQLNSDGNWQRIDGPHGPCWVVNKAQILVSVRRWETEEGIMLWASKAMYLGPAGWIPLVEFHIPGEFDLEVAQKCGLESFQSWAHAALTPMIDLHRANGAHVDITFDGPPHPAGAKFVRIEDHERQPCTYGTWICRDDGQWTLRIPVKEEL